MVQSENCVEVYGLQKVIHSLVEPVIGEAVVAQSGNAFCPETDALGVWRGLFDGIYEVDTLPKIFIERLAGGFEGMRNASVESI